MSEAIERFVSRDEADDSLDVWSHAPTWCADYEAFYSTGVAKHLGVMNREQFEALTGLTIKPGQCLRIRLTAEVLEGEA